MLQVITHKIKKIFFLIIGFIFLSLPLYAAKPIVAVTGVKAGNIRLMSVSVLLETQLINSINSAGVFRILNPELLKDQLTRYKCTDEECVLAFARTAKINLIIRAEVEDKGNSIVYSIYAQGINAPYYGRIAYKYSAEIPLSGLSISTIEFKFISEEHAVYFVSGLLKNYKAQFFINANKIDSEESVTGDFDLFRYDNIYSEKDDIASYNKIGRVNISNKEVMYVSQGIALRDNDFIFITFNQKAEFIESVFYGRKREMVFENKPLTDTAIFFFSTVPASALMPVLAPLSHYKNGDYSGLSLWALNFLPYLYIEYKGLTNRPDSYRNDRRDISAQTSANYRFGLYMLFCGGIPLVIDSFSNRMLYQAAGYIKQPYIGNTMSAVYLSLISGGGGLFYRGYRLEGYLYFHLHNILLYMALKKLYPDENYNHDTNSYVKENRDKKKAYAYLGALGVLKLIEITHVILVKDNIRNGRLLEESFGFGPAVYRDLNGISFGAQYTLRY